MNYTLRKVTKNIELSSLLDNDELFLKSYVDPIILIILIWMKLK